MKKKTSVKMLKVTSVVLAVEAVVVLILLLIILTGNWPAEENVDNSGNSRATESSAPELVDDFEEQQESSLVEGSQPQGEDSRAQQESKPQGDDESRQESGKTDQDPAQDPADREESEESISQDNWGEIDWN